MNRIESLKKFIDNQPSMFSDADATYNAIEELERLAEIGRATEALFAYVNQSSSRTSRPEKSIETLLNWYRRRTND